MKDLFTLCCSPGLGEIEFRKASLRPIVVMPSNNDSRDWRRIASYRLTYGSCNRQKSFRAGICLQ